MPQETWLWATFTGIAGALVSWWIGRSALDRERRARRAAEDQATVAQARLELAESAQDRLEEQWQQASAQLSDTFRSHSERTLAELQKQAAQLDRLRHREHGSLHQQLNQLTEFTRDLGRRSAQLTEALRGSAQSRGRWGETTLRNLIELAGLAEHADFEEQSATSEGLRPDLVVRLPDGGRVPVDAKVPLAAFLDAHAAENEEQRDSFLRKHAQDLRGHVRALSKRGYADQLPGPIDFTVLFLPGDAFLSAALAQDPELMEQAMADHVLIATPVTLFALLRTVRLYWRGDRAAEEAQQLLNAALELHRRSTAFSDHLAKVGRGLDQAVKAFNAACGSFDRRLIPWGRKIEEIAHQNQDRERLTGPEVINRTLAHRNGPEDLSIE